MSGVSELYARLNRRTLSEANLLYYGYPRPGSSSGKARVHFHPHTFWTAIPSPTKRNCMRCRKIYDIDSQGNPLIDEDCKWHLWKLKEGIYGCCGQGIHGSTCKTSPHHTTSDIDPNNLVGFINTSSSNVTTTSVFALDCEMVSTTRGLEVAAITMVDYRCEVVYETLVQAEGRILNYNTPYSGLTANDFRNVTTKLEHVHAKLMSLVGVRTILVGHGMHNDLVLLRVLHGRVVDTVNLYPHPRGFPVRNSLNYLKGRYLPNMSRPGLKCREDAVATMMLTRLKCGFSASP